MNQNGYQLPTTNQSLVFKQNEAVNKFNKNKSIMENNSMRVLNNYDQYSN